MKQTFHELLLSELHMVVYQPGDAVLTDRMLCEAVTLNENLRSLGFTLRPRDLVLLAAGDGLYSFYDRLHALVPQVNAAPMYPGFPQQVLNMDEATFRMHQMLHYFSTYGLEDIFGGQVSRGWLPESNVPERTKEADPILKAQVLELVPENEAAGTVLRILLGRRERLTNPELDLVTEAAAVCPAENFEKLTVRFKENLDILFPRLMGLENIEASVRALHAVCAHSGDVLRCAHSYIKGHGYHLKTAEKKRIVRVLEQYPVNNLKANLMQSCRLRERNLLVLRYVDYNRFAESAEHREAVRCLRNDELLSWSANAEHKLACHDPQALNFLAGRPGIMLRMINRLLSLDYSAEDILTALKPRAGQLSGQLLIKSIRTLGSREDKLQELYERELQACNDAFRREADEICPDRDRFETDCRIIHQRAESRRRNAYYDCSRMVRNETGDVLGGIRRDLKGCKSDLADCKADFEKIQGQLEKMALQWKADSLRLLRNADSDELKLLYLAFDAELLRQTEADLAGLKAEQANLEVEQADLEAQLSQKMAWIWTEVESRIPEHIRGIDAWEKAELVRLRTELEEKQKNEESRMKELLARHSKELDALNERHEQWLRISRFDAAAVTVLKQLCAEHFRQAETPLKGRKVFVSMDEFDLGHSELETADRSKDGGYIRSGIAFRIPEEATTVRFFVYWNDRQRVDIDLHAGGTMLDGRTLHVGWNASFKDADVVHSGDITHSDAAEYIDVDLSSPIRSINTNVNLYSGKPDFRHVETCFVGMMAVNELGEDVKLYSPANCFFTHRLTQEERNLYYGYIDVQNRFVRFIGQPNPGAWEQQCPMEPTFTLEEYLNLVLEGQNVQTVETAEEADVVLTMGKNTLENGLSLVDANFFLES